MLRPNAVSSGLTPRASITNLPSQKRTLMKKNEIPQGLHRKRISLLNINNKVTRDCNLIATWNYTQKSLRVNLEDIDT